jgi:riboflavin synthase
MFTGIIEGLGKISSVSSSGGNRSFLLSAPFIQELRVDQSLSHNGICLTIEAIHGEQYQVTAVEETLSKTNAGQWKLGDVINLERAMVMNGRLDGHLVQGHVDATATLTQIGVRDGSWEYDFQFPTQFAALMIEKGSVSVNGVSLTAYNVTSHSFRVAIIPYTYEHTGFPFLKSGDSVNIEFDMVGKYVNRFITLQNIQS